MAIGTIKRFAVAAATMLAATFVARAEMAAPPDHPSLLEETTFLDIRDGGTSYRLEALIVRPGAAKGRLPIALLSHGKPRFAADVIKTRATDFAPEARDLAYRGYLAVVVIRRGFGLSGGTAGRPTNAPYAKCNDADLRRYFAVESDDLERALRVVGTRPDADPTRAIAIGSSGGAGASIALGARNPPGLKAVVNLSGAMRLTDADGNLVCPQDMPIAALASFGSQTKIPTLWLYAENDSNFGPDAARKTHAAYVANGGVATLKVLPSLQPNDGHFLFELPLGRRYWLAELDSFLREQNLPTWDLKQVDTLMRQYSVAPARRKWIEWYFSFYAPKAMARSASGVLHYSAHPGGIEAAEKAALEGCQKAANAPCTTIMKNFQMVAPGN
jgi:dienelactone hydrolase